MRIKKDLYCSFIPHNAGCHGMGKAVPCGEGSGQADPTAARDLRRLRPCLAHDAGRIGAVEEPAGPGTLRSAVPQVEQ